MKRQLLMGIILSAIFMAFTTGCATQSENVKTSSNVESNALVELVEFDGYWQIPGGYIIYIYKNSFIIMSQEEDGMSLDTAGIFTHTGTQFSLNMDKDWSIIYTYEAVSENINVKTTDPDGDWANGIWIRLNDYKSLADSYDYPLAGYWETENENEIVILHIFDGGIGYKHTCDLNYNLKGESRLIEYDENTPSVFIIFISLGTGISMQLTYDYIFDGPDLLVDEVDYFLISGLNDDVSTYTRYTKK